MIEFHTVTNALLKYCKLLKRKNNFDKNCDHAPLKSKLALTTS